MQTTARRSSLSFFPGLHNISGRLSWNGFDLPHKHLKVSAELVIDLDLFYSHAFESRFLIGKLTRQEDPLTLFEFLEEVGKSLVARKFLCQDEVSRLDLEEDIPAGIHRPLKGLADRVITIDEALGLARPLEFNFRAVRLGLCLGIGRGGKSSHQDRIILFGKSRSGRSLGQEGKKGGLEGNGSSEELFCGIALRGFRYERSGRPLHKFPDMTIRPQKELNRLLTWYSLDFGENLLVPLRLQITGGLSPDKEPAEG